MGRQLRSHLDLLRPAVEKHMLQRQEHHKECHDLHAKARKYSVGDAVYAWNYAGGPTWLEGMVVETRGPLSFCIELREGRIIRRHVDQIRANATKIDGPNSEPCEVEVDAAELMPSPSAEVAKEPAVLPDGETGLRRSGRVRHPPDRFT